MSFARGCLDGPPIVLVTGDDWAGAVEAGLDSLSEEYVVDPVSATEAVDRASELRTACVVVDETALVGDLADSTAPPYVVVIVDEPDESVLRATRTSSTGGRVLLVQDADSRLGETVSTAVSGYLDRRSDALAHDALETLFDGLDRQLFVKDRAGRYLKFAPEHDRPEPEAVLGRTDADLADIEGFDEEYEAIDRQVVESVDPVIGTIVSHGDSRIEVTNIPWEDDGRVRGLVGYRKSVPEEQARERQLESENERIERYARYLAHDLRNPLVVANGYLEIAQDDGDETALDRIGKALDRMETRIEDLSKIARAPGDVEPALQFVELNELVRTVWDPLSKENPNTTLEVDVPAGTLVQARESDLRPLLENLFKNALVHGRPDGSTRPPLTVTVGLCTDGFYVADDGAGIPAEQRERVIEEGFSSAADRSGRGLAIVADVADSNDWEVVVEESADGGAQFELRNCLVVSKVDRGVEPGDPLALTETVDVGRVSIPGEAERDDDSWTVTAEGRDIWHDENDFSFVCTAVEGPVRIEGTVGAIEGAGHFSKAGLMVRDSLDEASAHGYIGRNPDDVIELLWRSTPEDLTTGQQLPLGDNADRPLRIDCVDDRLTCSVVDDEDKWRPVDQRRIDLSDPVYVGLAVCSTVPGETCTATFDDVSVRRLDVG